MNKREQRKAHHISGIHKTALSLYVPSSEPDHVFFIRSPREQKKKRGVEKGRRAAGNSNIRGGSGMQKKTREREKRQGEQTPERKDSIDIRCASVTCLSTDGDVSAACIRSQNGMRSLCAARPTPVTEFRQSYSPTPNGIFSLKADAPSLRAMLNKTAPDTHEHARRRTRHHSSSHKQKNKINPSNLLTVLTGFQHYTRSPVPHQHQLQHPTQTHGRTDRLTRRTPATFSIILLPPFLHPSASPGSPP